MLKTRRPIYRLNTAKFMYKAKTKILPKMLRHMFVPNTIVHDHNTRQSDNPHFKLKKIFQIFF